MSNPYRSPQERPRRKYRVMYSCSEVVHVVAHMLEFENGVLAFYDLNDDEERLIPVIAFGAGRWQWVKAVDGTEGVVDE